MSIKFFDNNKYNLNTLKIYFDNGDEPVEVPGGQLGGTFQYVWSKPGHAVYDFLGRRYAVEDVERVEILDPWGDPYEVWDYSEGS